MIGRERDDRVLQADGPVDPIEQLADRSIGSNRDIPYLRESGP